MPPTQITLGSMSRSRTLCKFFLERICFLGANCPDSHPWGIFSEMSQNHQPGHLCSVCDIMIHRTLPTENHPRSLLPTLVPR